MEDDNSVNYVNLEIQDDNVNLEEIEEEVGIDEAVGKQVDQTVSEKSLKSAPTENDSSAPKIKSEYKTSSSVWQHFTKRVRQVTKNDKKEEKQEVVCNHCKKVLAYSSKNGTSSMRKHLDRCTCYRRGWGDKKQKLLSAQSPIGTSSSQANNLIPWQFDQAACRRSFAEMVIIDEQPFKLIECEGFRRFISNIQPLMKFVSRTTVSKDVALVYESEKSKLMSFFQDKVHRVCLTTDLWTSIANEGYLCLTAHFVDEKWKLNKKIINFCICPPPHTGEFIANAILECLLKWNFHGICTITMDNASSNDVAARRLKEMLKEKGLLIGGGETFHVRCAAHIINLLVRDGIDEIQESVSRIRNVIKYVRGSPARKDKFDKYCQKMGVKVKGGLCLDVPTRWNSTYFMLASALKSKPVFDKLCQKDAILAKEGPPTLFDWDNAEVLCEFLKSFYDITNALSGSSYVTSTIYLNKLYEIEALLLASSRSDNLLLQDMSRRMREKFNKYWGGPDKINTILLIANVLDPRYKLRFVNYFYERLYDERKAAEVTQMVTTELHNMFNNYKSHSSANKSSNVMGECSQRKAVGSKSATYDFLNFCQAKDAQWSKTEIDVYLQEPALSPIEDIDVLGWWSVNGHRFKILSLIARDVFAIPVTTVASESAFSTGGRVLDSYRSSLSSNVVESLICCQDWLRSTPKPIDIEEVLGEISIAEPDLNSDVTAADSIPKKGKDILYEG